MNTAKVVFRFQQIHKLSKDNFLTVQNQKDGILFVLNNFQAQAMKDAMPVIMDVAKRFEKVTGRKYGFFEEYMIDDADVALVVIGSSAGTGKEAVDRLRAEGKRVGLIKLRVFRPFPRQQLAEAMLKVKAVAIMDKAESFSNDWT